MEVFAANGVDVRIQAGGGYTPTPVISHAILSFNRGKRAGLADGVVITPSHNPPDDGGFKYNPPSGGPADTGATKIIQDRANQILAGGLADVRRMPLERAMRSDFVGEIDYVTPYVADLGAVVDMAAIARSGIKIGADPLGGAGVAYWQPIAEMYGLDLTVVNPYVDPTFGFMTVDKDGKIRMDCSSPDAMASLIGLKDRFDIAFANDPDADRHGIVTPSVGLMNPESLFGRGHQVSFPTPPQLAGGCGGGQDPGQLVHDRPGGGQPGPPIGRSARGLQVVCGWPGGRLLRLRRRGERGGFLPAHGWHGVDHGQGRADPGPAGRGDHRGDGQGSRPALRGIWKPASAARSTSAWTPRPPRPKKRCWPISPRKW